MDAAEVFGHLSPIGDIPLPTCESQMRPMTGLEAPVAQQVWRKVIAMPDDKAITAKLVRNAVTSVRPRKSTPTEPVADPKARNGKTHQLGIHPIIALIRSAEEAARQNGGGVVIGRL